MWYTEPVRELTDLICPLSGQFLVYTGSEPHVLDGPSYYESEDGKFKYERSPWAFKRLYLVFPEKKVFKERDGAFVEIVVHFGQDIFVDSAYFEEEKVSAELRYRVEKLLREMEYQRLVREGKIVPALLPLIRNISFSTVARDLVSVQPLPAAAGTLLYYNYKIKRKCNILYKIRRLLRTLGNFLTS
jgi:hypothetical protein